MAKSDWETIEKYKSFLQKNPYSQIFAPLADAYLDNKMVSEAEAIAKKGTQRHPQFAGGWVILGKIHKERKKYSEAIENLEKARNLDPNNLLAHQLLGDIYLDIKEPKKALKAYKIVLFLNPKASKAQKVVQKLESLTADEFDSEVFQMSQLKTLQKNEVTTQTSAPKSKSTATDPAPGLMRMLSLVDAFIVRNDLIKAQGLLSETQTEYGDHPEVLQRQKFLFQKHSSQLTTEEDKAIPLAPLQSRELAIREKKLKILNSVLSVVNSHQI